MRRPRPFRVFSGSKSFHLKSFSLSVPLLLILTALLLNACNLASEEEELPTATPTTTLSASGKPRVVINSPTDGSTSPVNREILVSVSASDSRGVTRIQLQANDRIVQTLTSENANGQTTFNAVMNYTPTQTGQLLLRVIAYRGAVASDPSEIELNIGGANVPTSTFAPNIPTVPSIPTIDPNDPTCRARASTALNVRNGPSTDFNILRVMGAGEIAPIVGRTGSNDWWQVRIGNVIGWVSAPFTTVYGSTCQSVPVTSNPIPTTAPPTFTATPQPPVPTTAVPSPPDLIVTNLNGPTQLVLPSGGGSVTRNYSFTISNTGGDRTGQTVTSIRVIPGGQPTTISTANLRGGESIALNLDVTFTTAGNFRVEITADAEGTVTEQSEVNNTGSINVTVTQ
jgi:uncharacterized protein YgiM (DUF1202 family)